MSRKNMISHESWLMMCLLVLLCAVNLFLIKQNLSWHLISFDI